MSHWKREVLRIEDERERGGGGGESRWRLANSKRPVVQAPGVESVLVFILISQISAPRRRSTERNRALPRSKLPPSLSCGTFSCICPLQLPESSHFRPSASPRCSFLALPAVWDVPTRSRRLAGSRVSFFRLPTALLLLPRFGLFPSRIRSSGRGRRAPGSLLAVTRLLRISFPLSLHVLLSCFRSHLC